MDDEQHHQDMVQAQDDEYPLVALKNIVAFPHNRQALPIAREKTIRALEEAMLRADHMLAVSTQKEADIDDPQPRDIHDIGTLVEVVTMHRQHEGNVQVLIRGVARIHIDQYLEQEPFLHVMVSRLTEEQDQGPQVEALVRHTNNLFERYAQLNRRFSAEDINSILAIKTPAPLRYTCCPPDY